MSVILASTSQADAATTTTGVFQFSADSVITAMCTNGIGFPTTPAKVQLQLSQDNVNWVTVDSRWFGTVPSQTYYETFRLADYVGAQQFRGSDALSWLNTTTGWLYYRLYFYNNTGAAVTIAANDAGGGGSVAIPLVGVTATTGGAVGSWVPPEGGPVIVEYTMAYITGSSTGAALLSIGVGANATTAASNLIDGADVHVGVPVVYDNITDKGSNGKSRQLLTGAQAVTVTGSGNSIGLVGTLYVTYKKP